CAPLFEPGDLDAEDTVWLGALFPRKGPFAETFGEMNVAGADFARRELAQTTRALADPNAPLRVRRIALAMCDDSENAERAARHLADDVGVPAILGFRSGQEVVDLATSTLVHRQIVSVASLTSSPLITRIPQPPDAPRLVWRTTFSLEDVARAAAHMVHDFVEPRRPAGARTTRVTLVRGDDSARTFFSRAMLDDLVFN